MRELNFAKRTSNLSVEMCRLRETGISIGSVDNNSSKLTDQTVLMRS